MAACEAAAGVCDAFRGGAGGVPFTSRTTTLNEELGQVSLYRDNTGTLVKNVIGLFT